ncbi:DMT family transporter [Rhodococcus sp. SJ-3]|uniref:DMT family transporter n=1 Tax=Rhodococcus sp. SJ-3 TaxID=3454628 RepID=UPI003F7A1D90
MTAWIFLIGAILTEVCATLCLRVAALGNPRWYGAVGVGYVAAFTLLSAALAEGLALGIAYGIWTAIGIALTTLAGRILFQDKLSPIMGVGIGLIIAGVLLVELGAAH